MQVSNNSGMLLRNKSATIVGRFTSIGKCQLTRSRLFGREATLEKGCTRVQDRYSTLGRSLRVSSIEVFIKDMEIYMKSMSEICGHGLSDHFSVFLIFLSFLTQLLDFHRISQQKYKIIKFKKINVRFRPNSQYQPAKQRIYNKKTSCTPPPKKIQPTNPLKSIIRSHQHYPALTK